MDKPYGIQEKKNGVRNLVAVFFFFFGLDDGNGIQLWNCYKDSCGNTLPSWKFRKNFVMNIRTVMLVELWDGVCKRSWNWNFSHYYSPFLS